MTDEPTEQKYHWIVLFRMGQRPYLYLFRTKAEMTTVVKSHRARNGNHDPYAMWVIVDREIQEVVIT